MAQTTHLNSFGPVLVVASPLVTSSTVRRLVILCPPRPSFIVVHCGGPCLSFRGRVDAWVVVVNHCCCCWCWCWCCCWCCCRNAVIVDVVAVEGDVGQVMYDELVTSSDKVTRLQGMRSLNWFSEIFLTWKISELNSILILLMFLMVIAFLN